MPFGADDIVGVVALSLTGLHACVKGLTIISKANHYDRDVSNVRLQIELEQHSLFTWAEAVGLTHDPPTLQMSANDAAYVPEILQRLDGLLDNLEQLKRRYGLELRPTSADVEALDDESSTLSRLGQRPQHFVMRADEAIFQKRKSPWKKLKWITLDDKKVEKLLTEVRTYVAKLERFLEPGKLVRREGDLDGVLRDAVLNTTDPQKLNIIGREYEQASARVAIVAAARLKQTRLKLGFQNDLNSSMSSPPRSSTGSLGAGQNQNVRRPSSSRTSSGQFDNMRLLMRLLVLSRKANGHRILTHYDNKAVLLEWKSSLGADPTFLENRVNQVAGVLRDLGPSFHSLPCRGYVKDHAANRFGYIFDLPEAFQSALTSGISQMVPKSQNLTQMFGQPAPSLNQRLSVATTLLETLLNLHTAGLLHKELCSGNIVFLRRRRPEDDDSTNLSEHSMYVAGYVFARSDDPGEMTEPMESEVEADLYRHPGYIGCPRLPFQKNFDIFSVGCTLLEIGLWSSLRDILHEQKNKQLLLGGPGKPLRKMLTFSSTSTEATLVDDGRAPGGNEDGEPSLDLIRLRDELLLSQLQTKESMNHRAGFGQLQGNGRHRRCKILQSLEAAAGRRYTDIVEELLSVEPVDAGRSSQSTGTNAEDEYALDLEIKARSTVKDIMMSI